MPVVAGGGELEIGKVYECQHSRKGNFRIRIESVDGEWICGVITDGAADAIMSYSRKEEGDRVTVRDGHSYFIPVDESVTEPPQ